MKTDAQEFPLVIDGDKVKSGVAALMEKGKLGVAAALNKLKEAGVTLTDDQVKLFDAAFAEADAEKVAAVIDDATGVAEAGATGGGKGGKKPADTTDDEEPEDDGTTEADMPTDVEALQDMVKELRGKVKAAKKEATAAKAIVTEANAAVTREKLDRWVDEALTERNIPETFRPRLKREAMRESFATKKDVVAFVNEFDLAYIRPQLDGTGIAGGAMRESGGSVVGNFKFDEED